MSDTDGDLNDVDEHIESEKNKGNTINGSIAA